MQLSDPLVALKQGSAVKYKGRKTSRAGSEQRRRLILEASLRIVVREGVRGIRHRAVAKEAEVPLAATTYYFKDIQELINDTFTLHAEQSLEVVNQFSKSFFMPLIEGGGKSFIEAMNVSEDGLAVIVDNMTQYLVEKIIHDRDALIAEQAFRYESILSPHLCKLGQVHKLALMQTITDLLTIVHSPNPEEDATIMIAVIHRIEYEGLLVDPENLDKESIRATLLRQLTLMLNSRPKG